MFSLTMKLYDIKISFFFNNCKKLIVSIVKANFLGPNTKMTFKYATAYNC